MPPMTRDPETRHHKFNTHYAKASEYIYEERLRQLLLWGDNDFDGKDSKDILPILGEEMGEINTAILEGDEVNLLEEISQLGALCVKWIEHILEAKAMKQKEEYAEITPAHSMSIVYINGKPVIPNPDNRYKIKDGDTVTYRYTV
jgi:hypothetical protein